ncbi:hypothetical protein HJFPF1_01181 [Paramyrothecium foliicola]|nr:hypothetical protein HJFPF1_01181 [Paramyrothecium foliicola]
MALALSFLQLFWFLWCLPAEIWVPFGIVNYFIVVMAQREKSPVLIFCAWTSLIYNPNPWMFNVDNRPGGTQFTGEDLYRLWLWLSVPIIIQSGCDLVSWVVSKFDELDQPESQLADPVWLIRLCTPFKSGFTTDDDTPPKAMISVLPEASESDDELDFILKGLHRSAKCRPAPRYQKWTGQGKMLKFSVNEDAMTLESIRPRQDPPTTTTRRAQEVAGLEAGETKDESSLRGNHQGTSNTAATATSLEKQPERPSTSDTCSGGTSPQPSPNNTSPSAIPSGPVGEDEKTLNALSFCLEGTELSGKETQDLDQAYEVLNPSTIFAAGSVTEFQGITPTHRRTPSFDWPAQLAKLEASRAQGKAEAAPAEQSVVETRQEDEKQHEGTCEFPETGVEAQPTEELALPLGTLAEPVAITTRRKISMRRRRRVHTTNVNQAHNPSDQATGHYTAEDQEMNDIDNHAPNAQPDLDLPTPLGPEPDEMEAKERETSVTNEMEIDEEFNHTLLTSLVPEHDVTAELADQWMADLNEPETTSQPNVHTFAFAGPEHNETEEQIDRDMPDLIAGGTHAQAALEYWPLGPVATEYEALEGRSSMIDVDETGFKEKSGTSLLIASDPAPAHTEDATSNENSRTEYAVATELPESQLPTSQELVTEPSSATQAPCQVEIYDQASTPDTKLTADEKPVIVQSTAPLQLGGLILPGGNPILDGRVTAPVDEADLAAPPSFEPKEPLHAASKKKEVTSPLVPTAKPRPMTPVLRNYRRQRRLRSSTNGGQASKITERVNANPSVEQQQSGGEQSQPPTEPIDNRPSQLRIVSIAQLRQHLPPPNESTE